MQIVLSVDPSIYRERRRKVKAQRVRVCVTVIVHNLESSIIGPEKVRASRRLRNNGYVNENQH